MFTTAAQSITKKAPQHATKVQRAITSDAFAFHPVRKTRYDQVVPTAMFPSNNTAQATKRASQQQVARINTSAAAPPAENHSFAFYPVQRNRVRTVTPKTQRDCYGFYPANVVENQSVPTASIKDVLAIRAALRQQKQTKKISTKNVESVIQDMTTFQKTTTV